MAPLVKAALWVMNGVRVAVQFFFLPFRGLVISVSGLAARWQLRRAREAAEKAKEERETAK